MRCFTANQSLLWKDTLILVNATSLVAYNLSSSIPDEAQYHVFAPSRCEEENFLCMWAHQDDGKCTTASNMGNKDLLLAVTVMSNGTILVFRVDVGTVVHVARPQEGVCLDSPLRIVHAASWTADGDVVGMVTEAGDIFSYHLSRKTWSAKPIWRAPSSMVAFLPTGDIAAMCTQQGNKKVMDVFSSTNGGIRNIPLVSNRPVLSMVSHRTLALVVVTMDDGTFCVVTLHDAKDALFTKRWHHKPILSVAWGTLDGTTLLTGGWEGVLCTWSTVTFSMTPLPHLPGPIRSITYSCTDPTCVALILSTGRCLIVDTVASKIVRNFAGISLLGDGLYFQKMTTGWMKGRKVLALYHGTSDEIRFQNSKQGFTVGALHAAGANRVVPQEDISAAPSYSISNAVLYRTDQQHECIALFTTSSIRLCSGSAICTLRFFHYNSNPSRNEFILNTVIHDPHTGICSNAMMLSAHPTGACVVSGGPLETKIWIMSDGKSPQVHWECQRVLFRGTSDVAFSSDGSIFACLHRSTAESSRLSVYDTERVLNSGAWYPMFTMEYVDASSMPDQAQKNNHGVPTSEKAVRHGQQMKTPLRSLFFACNDQELFCSDDRAVYMWNILQHATKRSEVDEELNKNLKHFSAWRVETNHRVEAKKGKSDSSCATIQCVHPIPSSMRLKTRSLIGESQQKSLTEFTNLMILLSTNEFLVVQVRDETDNSSCTSSPVRIFSQVLLREMAHAELPVLQFVIVDEQVHLLLDSSKSRAVIWNNPAWRALITSDDTAEVERDSFEDMTTNRRTQTRSVLRPMLGGSLAVRNSSGSAPLAGSTPSISERLSGPSHELPPMTAILKAFFAASVAVQ